MNVYLINNTQTLSLAVVHSKGCYGKNIFVNINKSFRPRGFVFDLSLFLPGFGFNFFLSFLRFKFLVKKADSVYVPNVNNLIANYAFYRARKSYVISEGLLTFSNKRLVDDGLFVIGIKIFISLVLGFLYRVEAVHVTGFDSNKSHGLLLPSHYEKVSGFNNAILLDVVHNRSAQDLNPKCAIFFGQHYHQTIPRDVYLSHAENMAKFINALRLKSFFYKPHPLALEQDPLVRLVDGAVVLDVNGSCEDIVEKYKAGCCLSINSTALFDLKSIFGDGLVCWALLPECESDIDTSFGILNAFVKSGIEIARIPSEK